jgi:hypothetical protein
MTETIEPKFLIHQATHLFLTDPIFFQVTQMNNSVFVWIGKSDGKLGDMSLAVPPLGTQVKKSCINIVFFSCPLNLLKTKGKCFSNYNHGQKRL